MPASIAILLATLAGQVGIRLFEGGVKIISPEIAKMTGDSTVKELTTILSPREIIRGVLEATRGPKVESTRDGEAEGYQQP
jgi:hypothetical protein